MPSSLLLNYIFSFKILSFIFCFYYYHYLIIRQKCFNLKIETLERAPKAVVEKTKCYWKIVCTIKKCMFRFINSDHLAALYNNNHKPNTIGWGPIKKPQRKHNSVLIKYHEGHHLFALIINLSFWLPDV
jgi:hypothetical protein